MTGWSRNLFGVSIVFGVGVAVFGERLPEGWGPASILVMVLAASAVLICSIADYRRERAAAATVAG